ncbi:MAG: family 1 extracellular solute-binding protein [Paenibacillaceae bacterium]|jgi:multiple sugar transport system substrate-binding protein|nr:family 1 extracellular solute-binding protein [Paenibacillaceae bacterium]
MKLAKIFISVLFMALIVTTTGCSIHGDNDPNSLKIWISPWDSLTGDDFDRYITQPVAQKYPDIRIQKLVKPITEKTFNEFKKKGVVPDVIITTSPFLQDLKPFGYLSDVGPWLATTGIDLGRLDPLAVESVKNAGGEGVLTGIPFIRQFNALYYNKDIFDKFKVPYPKDGMTWKEAAVLAARVTKKDGETQVRGLEPDIVIRPASALRVSYIDGQTGQAVVNNDKWRKVFDTLKLIYDIPGNQGITKLKEAFGQFFDQKQLAMLPGINWLHDLEALQSPPSWDIVSYPTFDDAPATGPQFDGHVLVVTEASKHKAQSAQVLETLLSDEVQMQLSQNGRVSVLADNKMKAAFGSNVPQYKQKNLQAIFKTNPAIPNAPTVSDQPAGVIMDQAMQKVVRGSTVEQALKDADDQINLYLYLKE